MSKTNKLGLVLLWGTGLLVTLSPLFLQNVWAAISLCSVYLFVSWIGFIMSLITRS